MDHLAALGIGPRPRRRQRVAPGRTSAMATGCPPAMPTRSSPDDGIFARRVEVFRRSFERLGMVRSPHLAAGARRTVLPRPADEATGRGHARAPRFPRATRRQPRRGSRHGTTRRPRPRR
jgi:hypothetical protein